MVALLAKFSPDLRLPPFPVGLECDMLVFHL